MTERDIFEAALAVNDSAERLRYVEKACAGDQDLQERVLELLQLDQADASLLNADALVVFRRMDSGDMNDSNARAEGEPGLAHGDPREHLRPFLAEGARPDSLGRLGHYEILQILGQGGFGIVLKAFDDSLHRVVAIKVLHPNLAATSPPRKRFLREARAAAAVKHEHVVQIHAVEEDPIPYLVMEFVEGQTLQELMSVIGPLSADEVVRLGRQIALGLLAAHQQKLVHRDIKPANLLLEAGVESRIKLTDFGLARTTDAASQTQSGVFAGTPMYMSPEQVRGDSLDHRSDLFSLGSVLYAMTVGHPPFRAKNTLAVLKRVAEDAPRPIEEIIPETPIGLRAVIAKLLEKKPEDRFESAREVVVALDRCLTQPLEFTRAKGSQNSMAGSSRVWAIAAVAVVLLLAGIGSWLRNRKGDDQNIAVSTNGETKAVPDRREVIAALPVGQQLKGVTTWIKELNPDFDEAKLTGVVSGNEIAGITIADTKHLYDLSPLAALPRLTKLELVGPLAMDLSILRSLKLEDLSLDFSPEKHAAILWSLPGLQRINGQPAAEFLSSPDHVVWLEKSEWEKVVAGLEPQKQSQAVMARLKRLNPGWSEAEAARTAASIQIQLGVVHTIQVHVSPEFHDLSPLHALPKLQELAVLNEHPPIDIEPLRGLKLRRAFFYCQPKDIAPLAEMDLEFLWIQCYQGTNFSVIRTANLQDLLVWYTPIYDLTFLKEAKKLTNLNMAFTPVADLSPLRGNLALQALHMQGSKVTSLEPIRECKNLTYLDIKETSITDLSPLLGTKLEHIKLAYDPEKHREFLLSLKHLKIINDKPAAEVLSGN